METIKTWKYFFWRTRFYFDTSHFLTYAKILIHANFMDPRHPRQNFDPRHPRHFFVSNQNFMVPRHPCQIFNRRHLCHFFDPCKNFTDTCHSRQSFTQATHEPTYPCTHATHATLESTPPTLFSRLTSLTL